MPAHSLKALGDRTGKGWTSRISRSTRGLQFVQVVRINSFAVRVDLSPMPGSERQWVTQEVITRDADVMHGTPVFRGTRVVVQTQFDYIENGESLDDFLEGFPTINRELAVQVLEACKELRLA